MPNLIDPRYCCCAIPLVNAGIYAILLEQIAVAMATGVLCLVAPSVTGAEAPSVLTYVLAAICFVGVVAQPIGFFGVFREKTTTFRVYSLVNAILTAAALIVAAIIIVISAVNHNKAVSNCQTDFFSPTNTTTTAAEQTLTEESKMLCMAFAWADIGFMGGLWVILFVTQTYFVWTSRGYGVAQVSDHKLYHSVYSENPEAFTMSILQSRRYNPDSVMFTNSMYGGAAPRPSHGGDAWDHRPSYESGRHEPGPESGGAYYNHQRGYSDGRADAGQFDDYNPNQQHPDQYTFNAPGAGYVDGNAAATGPGHVHYGNQEYAHDSATAPHAYTPQTH